MSLTSGYTIAWGVTAEDEAHRLVIAYGLPRACQVAEVLAGKLTPGPFRGFWWQVSYQLSQRLNEPGMPETERRQRRFLGRVVKKPDPRQVAAIKEQVRTLRAFRKSRRRSRAAA